MRLTPVAILHRMIAARDISHAREDKSNDKFRNRIWINPNRIIDNNTGLLCRTKINIVYPRPDLDIILTPGSNDSVSAW